MLPRHPADVVVLAVGVVVALLRAAELVAGEQHRRTLGQEQGREHVALLPVADLVDLRIVRGAFHPVIEGVVVGMAVAILLAVRLVVLLVVRNEVVQRETIMGGDEVHRRPRLAAAPVEQVA